MKVLDEFIYLLNSSESAGAIKIEAFAFFRSGCAIVVLTDFAQ